MRLKVIGIQMEGDKHGKKLMTPRKNTFIEDVRESALGKMRVFVMVRPCNMSKKGEDDIHQLSSIDDIHQLSSIDDIATIWNAC